MVFTGENQKEQEDINTTKEEENLAQTSSIAQEEVSPPSRVRRGFSERRRRNRYKKSCWLCRQGKLLIDYKDTEFLKNYLRRYNKILIHKVSGNCLKHQHQLAQAIKRARFIALLPFIPE